MPPFKTQPHGEHEIVLIEDAVNPLDRIYEIRQKKYLGGETTTTESIGILGSELISIIAWFNDEKNRTGQDVNE